MMNEGIKFDLFNKNKKRLEGWLLDVEGIAQGLGSETHIDTLKQLHQRVQSDRFKIMVLGEFKRGKSTFINALLGEEILPAYAVPCTAIINEIKYADVKRAILYFRNPVPEEITDNIPDDAKNHIVTHKKENVPEMEIEISRLEEFVAIPEKEEGQKNTGDTPYDKAEIYWPLPLCKNGVEIIDSPGLNEDGIRTKITTEYLEKVDAILFVSSCAALASKSEINVIDQNIRGAGHEFIFFICNRFDEIRKQEKERVVERGKKLLGSRTGFGASGVFFISAINALDGRLDKKPDLLESSGILPLEEKLYDFLTKDRAKVKLLQPTRGLMRVILELSDEIIPARRNSLLLSKDELEKRYKSVEPQLRDMEKRCDIIIKTMRDHRNDLGDRVKQFVITRMVEIADNLPDWANEIEVEGTIGINPLKMQQRAEEIAYEVGEKLKQRIDQEQDTWQKEILLPLVQKHTEEMNTMLEGKIEDFYTGLDQLKVQLFGEPSHAESPQENISGMERFVAAVGGFIVGGAGAAFVGGALGFKEMLKSLGPQIAIVIGMFVLGFTNPITIIPALIAAGILQLVLKANTVSNKIKNKIVEGIKASIKEKKYENAEAIAKEMMKKVQPLEDAASKVLGKEIKVIKEQVEAALRDLGAGEAHVKSTIEELNNLENKVKVLRSQLGDFVFDIAENKF